MKAFKRVLLVLLILIAAVLTYVYVSLDFYTPDDPEIEVDETAVDLFSDSYEHSRKTFLMQAESITAGLDSCEIFSKTVPSKFSNDLSIDICYIPAQEEPRKLFILTSGTHGVEGYVGGAVQLMFMKEMLSSVDLSEMGILLVHGVNPYGFKFTRRVTENNIDFNRNCEVDPALYSTINNGYNDLYEMLNPEGPAAINTLKNRFFLLVAINKLLQESMASLKQAILQGQYEHKKGLYFGGHESEPNLLILQEVFQDLAQDYEMVFNIDLHTGYGERGTTHLFPNPIEDEKVKSALEGIFEGYTIDWGDSDQFYTINGSFTDFIGKLFPDKFYLPMLFEYGTLNSQSTVGSVKSLQNMVLENQGSQYGYKSSRDSLRIKHSFMEMYNPSSPEWRSKIIQDSRKLLEQSLDNYLKL